MVEEVTPQEFLARRAAGRPMILLDVREDWELETAPVPAELVHIPMDRSGTAWRIGSADGNRGDLPLGGRSLQVANFLKQRGFASVLNLAGGVLAWSRDVNPAIPQY